MILKNQIHSCLGLLLPCTATLPPASCISSDLFAIACVAGFLPYSWQQPSHRFFGALSAMGAEQSCACMDSPADILTCGRRRREIQAEADAYPLHGSRAQIDCNVWQRPAFEKGPQQKRRRFAIVDTKPVRPHDAAESETQRRGFGEFVQISQPLSSRSAPSPHFSSFGKSQSEPFSAPAPVITSSTISDGHHLPLPITGRDEWRGVLKQPWSSPVSLSPNSAQPRSASEHGEYFQNLAVSPAESIKSSASTPLASTNRCYSPRSEDLSSLTTSSLNGSFVSRASSGTRTPNISNNLKQPLQTPRDSQQSIFQAFKSLDLSSESFGDVWTPKTRIPIIFKRTIAQMNTMRWTSERKDLFLGAIASLCDVRQVDVCLLKVNAADHHIVLALKLAHTLKHRSCMMNEEPIIFPECRAAVFAQSSHSLAAYRLRLTSEFIMTHMWQT